ncbi:MAG: A24 family peptidase [Rhizomicrobium sp.]
MTVDALSLSLIVAAPFIGSFLGVVAIRLTQGRTVLFGRSACDSCGAVLAPRDLVPLASFALLRGRCRRCGAGIDPLHVAMELGAAAVAVWAAVVTSGWILVASCALGWTLLTLAAIDWRSGLLPDVLTLPLAALGLGVAFALDRTALPDHVLGAVAGFAVFWALAEIYRRLRGRDGLGLGDAKLLGAAGAWLSWSALPTVVLFAAFLGLALVLARRARGQVLTATDRLAFGPALAAATWLVWLYGPLVPA